MADNIQILNSYGKLVASYIQAKPSLAQHDIEHLKFIMSELGVLYKDVAEHQFPRTARNVLNQEFKVDDTQNLLRAIDEIRLRMVTVLLGAGLFHNSSEQQFDLNIQLTKPLETGLSGLTWGQIGKTCILLMPPIDGEENANDTANDIAKIFEDNVICDHWIVDFSAVNKLTVLFLAILLSYKDGLQARNVKTSFVWLSKPAVPEVVFDKIERVFELRQIGDYFFSKGLKSEKTAK